MAGEANPIVVQDCPSRDELDAFASGRLSLEQVDAIADHLSHCPACEASLEGLYSEDTLLSHLRREPEGVFPREDPAWEELEILARAIPLEHPSALTVTDAESGRKKAAGVAGGPRLPAAFGAYQLLALLGQGGMGMVYLARQEAIKRLVALKMVRAGIYANAEERQRFQREGEVIARVRHPNVVQIFEFNEHDGQLYFSMELLEGGTLATRLNGRPMAERAAAELVRTLAQAVHVAHQEGIVHRDLKPTNVLFGTDGTMKLTDFGLAKVIDTDSGDTRTDAILGTPAYMAPEQARGESRKIGPAADVHALGAILYETLTGRPPFRAETRVQTLELVRDAEPEPPSRYRRRLARDLEAICLKCLEKEPSRRYVSAAALAEDLDRWLKGEPTAARPLSRAGRLRRSLRRHPRTVAAMVLLAILGLTGSLAWFRYNPERPIRDIESRLERGEAVTLLGETGKPAWFRLVEGASKTQISERPDGAFTIHSWGCALVELVRDPRCDHFRFRAEVRHENTAYNVAHVGIYVAHRTFPTPQGTVQSEADWIYNDIDTRLRLYNQIRPELRALVPPPEGNIVGLRSLMSSADETSSLGSHSISISGHKFEPAGKSQKPDWRSLALEVSPQGIRTFWEGEFAGEVTAEKWEMHRKTDQKRTLKQSPANLLAKYVDPGWHPRGGLGLNVQRGSASFRNVAIEPLTDPQ